MPESKSRKTADEKKKIKRHEELVEGRADKAHPGHMPSERRWVPPVFITLGLLGVAWLVVYYVAGAQIPGMRDLKNWNMAIGMGLMASAFGISTLWR